MQVIGEIIKKAIDLGEKLSATKAPVDAQKDVLVHLLDKAKNTAFGKYYAFEQILASEDPAAAFANKVPYHDYDAIYEEWWSKIREGHKDITWPGINQYIAVSSGTTSASKYIPVTDEMLECIRKTGIKQIMTLSKY